MDKTEVTELMISLCSAFGVPMPLLSVASTGNDYRGKFDSKNYHVFVSPDTREQMMVTTYHEFRHVWQYHYYQVVYLVGVTSQTPYQYHMLCEQAIESDAVHFGNSLGRQNMIHLLDYAYQVTARELFAGPTLEYSLLVQGRPVGH